MRATIRSQIAKTERRKTSLFFVEVRVCGRWKTAPYFEPFSLAGRSFGLNGSGPPRAAPFRRYLDRAPCRSAPAATARSLHQVARSPVVASIRSLQVPRPPAARGPAITRRSAPDPVTKPPRRISLHLDRIHTGTRAHGGDRSPGRWPGGMR